MTSGDSFATENGNLPLVREVAMPDIEGALRRLAARPYCLFLDSARPHATLGRYSFLAADPFDVVRVSADGSDALAELACRLAPFQSAVRPELPPFQGGGAGLLGYELSGSLERVPRARWDEFQLPALAWGIYDVVLAIDHVSQQAWIISQGFPELDPVARCGRARDRLEAMHAWLTQPVQKPPPRASLGLALSASELAPRFQTPGPHGLTSNFTREGYLQAVARCIEYIRAGDIFQANLSQRLLIEQQDDPLELYLRLRSRNSATFAAYFDAGDFQIASASPERLVQVRELEVEARPIKGTRGRTAQPEADLFAGDELQQSEKDRSENIMIVDLLRNDLSRVCTAQSVRVAELCRLESYEFVQHLVSVVRGQLRPGLTALDLLRAAFPGGSITGAPKVRAMQIIAALEPTARGAYCGSLAYLGFGGMFDSSILIRTITACRDWWQLPVGGGVVVKSQPEREYEETWHKAQGMLRSLWPQ